MTQQLQRPQANPTYMLIGMLAFGLLMAVALRCFQILGYPMGQGQYVESPDGKYLADAYNMYDENFWGSTRRYYQFQVKKLNGETLISKEIPEPVSPIRFRDGDGLIMWSMDSKSVQFGTPDKVIWQTELKK